MLGRLHWGVAVGLVLVGSEGGIVVLQSGYLGLYLHDRGRWGVVIDQELNPVCMGVPTHGVDGVADYGLPCLGVWRLLTVSVDRKVRIDALVHGPLEVGSYLAESTT